MRYKLQHSVVLYEPLWIVQQLYCSIASRMVTKTRFTLISSLVAKKRGLLRCLRSCFPDEVWLSSAEHSYHYHHTKSSRHRTRDTAMISRRPLPPPPHWSARCRSNSRLIYHHHSLLRWRIISWCRWLARPRCRHVNSAPAAALGIVSHCTLQSESRHRSSAQHAAQWPRKV